MKLNSKYFDSIRIAPRKRRGVEEPPHVRRMKREQPPKRCEWAGCRETGTFRAPRAEPGSNHPLEGAAADGQYIWFCEDHIREFNRNYDFFKGMSDADVATFQREALTGHRPTWNLGVNAAKAAFGSPFAARLRRESPFRDTFGFFDETVGPDARERQETRRKPRALEQQALDTLDLPATATLNEIKARYKELVKRHHPDANGGDRSAEERLRKVIQAYDYLRKSGFCS
ncbi:MAG: J domain-containing protein [Parvibaculum sp.]|uniref:J domain-containing protein n=1 Tax=Parvibaculum sp. TaxID=2024848 RepID=UPI002ABAA97D|nr:J domain-containing protein [Parvibaculum sp.]MDZ4381951.1 J domain-containing protein [Parvibaculum sp.]